MSRAFGLLILLAAAAALGACAGKPTRPVLPDAAGAVAPQVQIVERIVYVRVPAWLTTPEPIAEGPLRQCPQIAAQREAALASCNAKLQAVGAIEGTEVGDE